MTWIETSCIGCMGDSSNSVILVPDMKQLFYFFLWKCVYSVLMVSLFQLGMATCRYCYGSLAKSGNEALLVVVI